MACFWWSDGVDEQLLVRMLLVQSQGSSTRATAVSKPRCGRRRVPIDVPEQQAAA